MSAKAGRVKHADSIANQHDPNEVVGGVTQMQRTNPQ
jgi:hypothetical protein